MVAGLAHKQAASSTAIETRHASVAVEKDFFSRRQCAVIYAICSLSQVLHVSAALCRNLQPRYENTCAGNFRCAPDLLVQLFCELHLHHHGHVQLRLGAQNSTQGSKEELDSRDDHSDCSRDALHVCTDHIAAVYLQVVGSTAQPIREAREKASS